MIGLLADLFLLLGGLFLFLGALGLIRMPDVYNRIQAGTKAVTLGTLALLLGVGLHQPTWWPKLLVLAILILVTNPVGSSTLARAFLRSGIELWKKGGQDG
jgi:multicomponent Na+:H+ antiporter subunit G